jgi:hypothetical protein
MFISIFSRANLVKRADITDPKYPVGWWWDILPDSMATSIKSVIYDVWLKHKPIQAALMLAPHPPPASLYGILKGFSGSILWSYFIQVLPGALPLINLIVSLYYCAICFQNLRSLFFENNNDLAVAKCMTVSSLYFQLISSLRLAIPLLLVISWNYSWMITDDCWNSHESFLYPTMSPTAANTMHPL